MQKNMRKINKQMSLKEIEKTLSIGIAQYIENTMNLLKDNDYDISNEEINEIKEDITTETYFNLQLLTLKSEKAMNSLGKD
ncbi:MAG: hypothetical protein MJ209_00740 [archaeon]|nr:hypothetical protein [archaeon]